MSNSTILPVFQVKLPLKKQITSQKELAIADTNGDVLLRMAQWTNDDMAGALVTAVNSIAELVAVTRNLAQIVYTQNGNQHADVTNLLARARAIVEVAETALPVLVSE